MLTIRNDLIPFTGLRTEMDRLFNRFFETSGLPLTAARTTFPALNMWETDDALFIEAETPGVALDDLEITVTGQDLTIKGKPSLKVPEEAAFHRRERGTGEFHRVVRLPFLVDADAIEANLQHGVLTLKLPKPAEVRPRRITVKQIS